MVRCFRTEQLRIYRDVLLCKLDSATRRANNRERKAAVSLITDDINSGHSSGLSALYPGCNNLKVSNLQYKF